MNISPVNFWTNVPKTEISKSNIYKAAGDEFILRENSLKDYEWGMIKEAMEQGRKPAGNEISSKLSKLKNFLKK